MDMLSQVICMTNRIYLEGVMLWLDRLTTSCVCFLRNLNHVTKMRLLSWWNIAHADIELVCSTWRSGVRPVLGLPNQTDCALIPLINGRRPLYDEVIKRMLCFISTCLMCDNQLVNFVARCSLVWSHDVSVWQEYPSLSSSTWGCCRFVVLDSGVYFQSR